MSKRKHGHRPFGREGQTKIPDVANKLTASMGMIERLAKEHRPRTEVEQQAVENVQKILDESGLNKEESIKALKMAGDKLGVPFPDEPDTKVVNQGEISFTRDKIPSVTGGKSPAMDFTHALMRGDPEARRLVEQATGLNTNEYMLSVDEPTRFMTGKRKEQSLADMFMSSTYDWVKYFNYSAKQEKLVMPILNHYRQALRQSHRFVLDNEFTQYATEVSNNTKPEKLLYRLQFATLPYETTWIEFNLHVKVRTMRAYHHLQGVPDGVAHRMGVLIKRIDETSATVEMVGESIADGLTCPCLHGYVYSLDERTLDFNRKFNGLTPFSMQRRVNNLMDKNDPRWADLDHPDRAEIIDVMSRGSLWGYGKTSGVITDARDAASNLIIPPFLLRHGELAFSPFYDFFELAGLSNIEIMKRVSKTMNEEIAEFSGMMRWIVTVLAMLNEVPTRSEFAQPSHMVRAGLTKRLPAFDYHRITLRLPKTKPVPYLERHLANAERKHRAHMVREHWRTYLSEKPCGREEHTWEYDYENGYRLCGKCLSASRLIHEHKRGDESLGWIHHEYTIKKRSE